MSLYLIDREERKEIINIKHLAPYNLSINRLSLTYSRLTV